MIFTAMVRSIIMGNILTADARLEGIDDHGVPYRATTDSTLDRIYLNNSWTPPFDLGGGALIITHGTGVYAGLDFTGGLVLSGQGLPYTLIKDLSNNPVLTGGNYTWADPVFDGDSTTLLEYHEYTHNGSVITHKEYALNGASGSDGTHVGVYDSGGNTSVSYVKGTLSSTKYFIHLAVPLLQIPGDETRFIIVKQSEIINAGPSSDAIDLRQYIKNMTWSTSIEKGFDTATIELNESASNLGKFFSYLLGNNVEIIDIYGNICWNGIITSIYVDGNGGRIDAVGYKQTMSWFRFDKIYAAPSGGWDSGTPGPTSSQVFHDTTLMNPYARKIVIDDVPANWGLKGKVTDYLGNPTGQSWPEAQLTVTSNTGLNELDFSDGSFKCIDAIELVESFGYAYTNESSGESKDTVYLQFWNDGFCRVLRVRKDPSELVADYIITKKNVKTGNRGVEISGDINNIVTESYVIYNDSEGETNVSGSSYNLPLLQRFGFRLKIQSSDYGPALATLIASVSKSDKTPLIGIGSVQVSGNVKGGGGHMLNLPCYMMRAGRVVEFEDNIGHGSLYKNSQGTPGIFYIGSTSFSTDTGELSLTPATTLSAVEMFIKRESRMTN